MILITSKYRNMLEVPKTTLLSHSFLFSNKKGKRKTLCSHKSRVQEWAFLIGGCL